MAVETAPKAERLIDVFLVHGTFSKNAKWIRSGSLLRGALAERIIGAVAFVPVSWSGKNSVKDRTEAALKLREKLDASDADVKVIIGHSHGGSIGAQAVELNEIVDEQAKLLVTLNTPFLVPTLRSAHSFVFFLLATSIGLVSLASNQMIIQFGFGFGLLGLILGFSALLIGISKLYRSGAFMRFILRHERRSRNYDSNTRTLCIGTADDEAYHWLQFFEVISNGPYLLIHVFALPFVFVLMYAGHYWFQWPFTDRTLAEAWFYLEINQAVAFGESGWEMLKTLFLNKGKLDVIEAGQFSEIIWSREDDFPQWWLTLTSTVEYFFIFWLCLSACALAVSYLIYTLFFGAPHGAQSLLTCIVSRMRLSPVPLQLKVNEFVPIDSTSSLLRHSDAYDNDLVLDFVSTWINQCSRSDDVVWAPRFKLRDQREFPGSE